jgi:hypothetical protein
MEAEMTEELDPTRPPRDVVELKAAWFLVRDDISTVAAEEPTGDAFTAAGYEGRRLSDDQAERLQRAQSQLARLSSAILASPWRRAVSKGGGWSVADEALAASAARLAAELNAQSPTALRDLADVLSADRS